MTSGTSADVPSRQGQQPERLLPTMPSPPLHAETGGSDSGVAPERPSSSRLGPNYDSQVRQVQLEKVLSTRSPMVATPSDDLIAPERPHSVTLGTPPDTEARFSQASDLVQPARLQTNQPPRSAGNIAPEPPGAANLGEPYDAPVRLAQQPEMVLPTRPQTSSEPTSVDRVFGPDQVRLPMLGETSGVGATPHPSPEVKAQFKQYVENIIDPNNVLELVKGRPRILVFKEPPTRVQLGDDAIATYTVITPNELSVTGTALGKTVLNLWFADPKAAEGSRVLSYLVRVIRDPEEKERLDLVYKSLELEINKAFPDSVVHLMFVGDKVVLTGEAKDIVEAAHILRIVSANAPGGNQQFGGGGSQNAQLPANQFNITGNPNQFGELPLQPGPENSTSTHISLNVVNLLRVPGEQQVMLRVTVAEVNRSAARSIGMDFSIANGGSTIFAQQTNSVVSGALAGAALATNGANLPLMLDNGQVSLAIRALRTLNLARSLAEPNLVTLNGQPAQFRAGGEFPVPNATATFGAVGQSVAFIPFGVQIRFIPYITDRDRVRLQMIAVVSTLDTSLSASISGSNVPGLNTRTFSNSVEMRGGQTLAVAGLIQNNYGATTNRVPLFGDLPVVGNFFGRNNTTSQEQEVVVLVTPELVQPIDACQTPGLPGDDVFEPGDIEFYLLNRLESRRSNDYRTSVRTDYARMQRYHYCEDQFIIGNKGQVYGCCPSPEKGGGRKNVPRPPAYKPVQVSSRSADGERDEVPARRFSQQRAGSEKEAKPSRASQRSGTLASHTSADGRKRVDSSEGGNRDGRGSQKQGRTRQRDERSEEERGDRE